MIFLHAHSGVRYLVLLAGVMALAYAVFGLATGRPHDRRMRILGSTFTGFMDLNVLLGVAVLFSGRFPPQAGVHIVTMILATAVAHVVPAVMKRREPEARSFGPYVVGTAVALAIVVAGILALGRPLVG